MTNPSNAAKMTTTTVGLAALLILVAGCGSDEPKTLTDVLNETNADRVTCGAGEWGGITDCAAVCSPKPASAAVTGCKSTFIIEVEGIMGACAMLPTPDRVDWIPCGVE
jgi:hypothetical protein